MLKHINETMSTLLLCGMIFGCSPNGSPIETTVETGITIAITAPTPVVTNVSGYRASITSKLGSTYSWSADNALITEGGRTPNIVFTAGTAGTLELRCVIKDSMSNEFTLLKQVAVVSRSVDPPLLDITQQDPTVYGSAINMAALGNLPIGGPHSEWSYNVSFRFRAKHSGQLTGFRVYVISKIPGGYAAGNLGEWTITLESDDGTSKHWPSGTVLASKTQAMNQFGGGGFPLFTFSRPANVTAGSLYHLVFRNTSADPVNNYCSLDCVYMADYLGQPPLTPIQPFSSDTDWYALVSFPSAPTTWYRPDRNANESFTPIMEYYYADGYSTGMGYIQDFSDNPKTISGTSSVREIFTVSGSSRTVKSIAVRVKRISGTNALKIKLEQKNGTPIDSVMIPSASVSTNYAWVSGDFKSGRTLTVGQSYNLVLSTPGTSNYNTYAIDKEVFSSNSYFKDGYCQFTTSAPTGWTGWDQWRSNMQQQDLQFYFTLVQPTSVP